MISAVVLSHNDGHQIARTLASLSWCDERIVIDDASDDNTAEAAKKAGAAVYARKLNEDFAAQRNFGLTKAKGEWVLFVDSDEIVSDSLRAEIQACLSEDTTAGFYLKRLDTLFGRQLQYGETTYVRLLRLGRKNAGSWKRPVHEVWDIRGQVGELSQPLLHYPHPNVAQFLDDINVYSTLNARFMYEQKKREPAWYIVAYPVAKFFHNYVVLRGFLDGMPGAILAIMMSFHSFLTRSKLYLLWQNARPQPNHSL